MSNSDRKDICYDPPRLAITVEPSDVYDPTGKMWMERCEELEQRDIDAVYWENEWKKLNMQLKDAKSFAKRCANSPVGQMIKQLDAVRGIFSWLLGENGDFPVRETGQGAYHWRKPLREKLAALQGEDK